MEQIALGHVPDGASAESSAVMSACRQLPVGRLRLVKRGMHRTTLDQTKEAVLFVEQALRALYAALRWVIVTPKWGTFI